MGIRKPETLACNHVNVGCTETGRTVTADIAVAKIVGIDDNDIRLFGYLIAA